jgi:uncharacterized protein YndB with AHSA1/START domain
MENTNDLKISLNKEFNVPVERLYEAWTSEKDLKEWWHPRENTLQSVTNDLKPGGKVAYNFTNNENKEVFIINGTYKEVEEGKKLVYTWNWQLPTATIQDSEFLLTIDFESTGNGSRLHIKQENFANEEAVQPHREGWEKGLSDLQQYLDGK